MADPVDESGYVDARGVSGFHPREHRHPQAPLDDEDLARRIRPMTKSADINKVDLGEAVFNCLGLGACGGLIGGAVIGIVLAGSLSGVSCGLGAAVPGALVGGGLGAPV